MAGESLHGGGSRAGVQPLASSQEVAGIEVAQDEVGIGDRWGRATLPVAGWAGIGSGAFWPDMQNAAEVSMRDGATAGPQSMDIKARQRHFQATH